MLWSDSKDVRRNLKGTLGLRKSNLPLGRSPPPTHPGGQSSDLDGECGSSRLDGREVAGFTQSRCQRAGNTLGSRPAKAVHGGVGSSEGERPGALNPLGVTWSGDHREVVSRHKLAKESCTVHLGQSLSVSHLLVEGKQHRGPGRGCFPGNVPPAPSTDRT